MAANAVLVIGGFLLWSFVFGDNRFVLTLDVQAIFFIYEMIL